MDGAPTGYEPSYIPLGGDSKRPVGKWKTTSGDIEDAVRMLDSGLNVGIAAREDDPLSIVDIDDPEQVDYLKPTLTVRTRSRTGDHAYYFGDGENAYTSFGEVRTDDCYAVAPGSYVPAEVNTTWPLAGYYTIESERRAAWITREEYPEFLRKAMNQTQSDIDYSEPEGKWEIMATIEMLNEVEERADEWNDGRYRTLRNYILPRLAYINHPNIQRWCSEWCQRSGGDWAYYQECNVTDDLPDPMSVENLNNKTYGPEDLYNFWKHLT